VAEALDIFFEVAERPRGGERWTVTEERRGRKRLGPFSPRFVSFFDVSSRQGERRTKEGHVDARRRRERKSEEGGWCAELRVEMQESKREK
jgi:hypothetical protein